MASINSFWVRVRLAFTGAFILILASVATLPRATAGVDVVGDDETDRFVGSGAVILPSSVDASTRRSAASCAGCRWRVTMPCQSTDGHQDAGCRGTTLGCPQGREIQRAWLALPGQEFEPLALYCPTDGEVTSVAETTSQVAGNFAHHVPALDPTCQPRRGVVVGLPVHCRSGQEVDHVEWRDEVAGMQVLTRAHGSWQWDFTEASGPDSQIRAAVPGLPYPEPGVQHTFSTAGTHRVHVTSTWTGEFTVDGLGPFPIEQPLIQRAGLSIPTSSALGVIRP